MRLKTLRRNAVRWAGLSALALLGGAIHAALPSLYLKIYRHDAERLADHPVGYVPVDPARPLPATGRGLVYVRVTGDLAAFTMDRLVRVLMERHLNGLDLSEQAVFGDKECAALSSLPSLTYLNVAGTAVTDAGLKALGKPARLQVLALGDRSTDSAIPLVAAWSRLESLSLGSAPISDAALEGLTRLPLKRVELGPAVTDAGLRKLAPLHKLRHLDLSLTQTTDAGVAALAAFPRLETLLAGRRLTSAGFLELSELPALRQSLRRLDLSNTSVDDRALGALALFPNLEELALTGTSASDTALRRLAHLPHLRALELSETLITGAGLDELRSLRDLEVLSISLSERLSIADLRPLSRLPKLRLLIVNGRPVAGPRLTQLKTKLHALDEAPNGPNAPKTNTDDFVAQLGPAVPTSGLRRLNIPGESAPPTTETISFSPA